MFADIDSLLCHVSHFQKQHGGYVLVTPAHGVSYPSTSHIRAAIRKAGLRQAGGSLPVVVDCSFIDTADYTSAKVRHQCWLYVS